MKWAIALTLAALSERRSHHHDGHIITGDGDLLMLNPWRGVRIVFPREFPDSVT